MKALLTYFIILISGVSISQTWPKYYGEPDRQEYTSDVIETYDKGYLICGGFPNYSWLIKTNINGDTLWSKILTCEGINWMNAVVQSGDGGFLICGTVKYDNSGYFPVVLKLNACGEKEWCKSFATSVPFGMPTATDIKETSSGEIIVLVNQFNANENVYLFKLNSYGDILWKKPYCSGTVYSGSDSPRGYRVLINTKNEFLINGYVYWENPWGPVGLVFLRPLFIKVDAFGNEEWVLPFGLQDTIIGDAYDIIELPENKYLGVGFYVDWTTMEAQPMFINLDNDGNVLNYRKLYSSEIDPVFSKGSIEWIFRKDSLYFLSGTFEISNTQTGPITNIIMDTNIFLGYPQIIDHFKHPLNQIWTYTIDTSYNCKLLISAIKKESGNRDIALSKLNLNLEYDTAYTGNFTYDSLCLSGPPQSGFIYLYDCDIITGTEIPSPEEYYSSIATIPIAAYPNPAETEITLAFQNTEHHNNMLLECYNIYGQKVHSEKIYKGQQKTKLDVSGWAKGLYVAVVKSNEKVAGTVRWVKR
jgi:hypothetical protein